MNKKFEAYRRLGRKSIAGWLAPEMLQILAVLDSAQRTKGVSGAVAEIGVHHGKFFIGLNLLQGENDYSVAIDVFGDQALNLDNSGKGDLAVFRRNLQRWSSLDRVVIHQGDSTELEANVLRQLARADIRFFSVDGGHTDQVVFSDMNLAQATITLGGIVFADDVLNQDWPGVATGTFRYLNQSGKLVPFSVGFNKVLFSSPEYAEYYREALRANFANRYLTYLKKAELASYEVVVFAKVPRRIKALASRNQTAKAIYHGLQKLRIP